jgi:hypothetical protein
MTEEFKYYGLPDGAVYVVGFLKILSAAGLIAGLIIPSLVIPSAILLGVLMMGALLMHLKVKDPAKKSLPAASMLVLCGLIILI